MAASIALGRVGKSLVLRIVREKTVSFSPAERFIVSARKTSGSVRHRHRAMKHKSYVTFEVPTDRKQRTRRDLRLTRTFETIPGTKRDLAGNT